jgi:excisionase family DNA binding protein
MDVVVVPVLETEYLDTAEATRFLRVSVSKLYRMRVDDNLPYIRNGRKVMYKKSELIEFLDGLRQNHLEGEQV